MKAVSEVLKLLNDAVAKRKEERTEVTLELRDGHEDEVDPVLKDGSIRR